MRNLRIGLLAVISIVLASLSAYAAICSINCAGQFPATVATAVIQGPDCGLGACGTPCAGPVLTTAQGSISVTLTGSGCSSPRTLDYCEYFEKQDGSGTTCPATPSCTRDNTFTAGTRNLAVFGCNLTTGDWRYVLKVNDITGLTSGCSCNCVPSGSCTNCQSSVGAGSTDTCSPVVHIN